jgi:Protein kinase domain
MAAATRQQQQQWWNRTAVAVAGASFVIAALLDERQRRQQQQQHRQYDEDPQQPLHRESRRDPVRWGEATMQQQQLSRGCVSHGQDSILNNSSIVHAATRTAATACEAVLRSTEDHVDENDSGGVPLVVAAPPAPPLAAPTPSEKKRRLRTRATLRKMEENQSRERLELRYFVDWNRPLGEGSFGVVYLGVDRNGGDRVAVKKISRKHTNLDEFQAEMRALMHLRDSGGHPNICSLRENFSSEDGYFYLVLDLIEGGEMFDHLVSQGACVCICAKRGTVVCFAIEISRRDLPCFLCGIGRAWSKFVGHAL